MSSDLTFLTNEQGNTLRDRFHVLLGENTRFFDVLVGYFYVSGFHQLYPSLESTEKIRVLMGLSTDRTNVDLLIRPRKSKQLDFIRKPKPKKRLRRNSFKNFRIHKTLPTLKLASVNSLSG